MIFAGYRITSPYGNRIHPIKKTELFHRGIDLVIGFQKPILSFTDGEVLFAKEGKTGSGFGNYGNVVAVRDKNKALHCYAHLDRIDVNVGNLVKRGDQLGTARDAVAWATRNGFADDQNLKETMTKEQIITILYRISKK